MFYAAVRYGVCSPNVVRCTSGCKLFWPFKDAWFTGRPYVRSRGVHDVQGIGLDVQSTRGRTP